MLNTMLGWSDRATRGARCSTSSRIRSSTCPAIREFNEAFATVVEGSRLAALAVQRAERLDESSRVTAYADGSGGEAVRSSSIATARKRGCASYMPNGVPPEEMRSTQSNAEFGRLKFEYPAAEAALARLRGLPTRWFDRR